MGRRKIEIKAIKDDRNRSVTFLKRKGGLFKKAHELSVLCSVDVAVIIFGHNKKLYEFSSGDINETLNRYQYYGGAHERKGPQDFMGKRDAGDDDEDEDENMAESEPEPQMMPPSYHNQPHLQHMRTHSSQSPPMPNGMPFPPRQHTPQPHPPHPMSRPGSRTEFRRTSSNLVPQHQASHPGQPQQSFAYVPNPPIYQGPGTPGLPVRTPPAHPPQPPQYQYPQPSPHHQPPQAQQAQMQHAYLQQQHEQQRRQSMPPAMPQQQEQRPPPPPQPTVSPPQPEQHFQSPPVPQPKPLSQAAKSHSIFTPIEGSSSLLAAHWGTSTTQAEVPRSDAFAKVDQGARHQSIDVAEMQRNQVNGLPNGMQQPPRSPQPPQQPRAPPAPMQQPSRTATSTSIAPGMPPSRTNSLATDAKRPRLKVEIPDQHSDGTGGGEESASRDTAAHSTPHKRGSADTSHSSTNLGTSGAGGSNGRELPPPSPSAGALLSAGAVGPPNPFARPAPPTSHANGIGLSAFPKDGPADQTPISALPSRFMGDALLPSPSSFYPPEWGFGRSGDSNVLPSPLNFQTPVVGNGPLGWGREDLENVALGAAGKRKASDDPTGAEGKRLKGEA